LALISCFFNSSYHFALSAELKEPSHTKYFTQIELSLRGLEFESLHIFLSGDFEASSLVIKILF